MPKNSGFSAFNFLIKHFKFKDAINVKKLTHVAYLLHQNKDDTKRLIGVLKDANCLNYKLFEAQTCTLEKTSAILTAVERLKTYKLYTPDTIKLIINASSDHEKLTSIIYLLSCYSLLTPINIVLLQRINTKINILCEVLLFLDQNILLNDTTLKKITSNYAHIDSIHKELFEPVIGEEPNPDEKKITQIEKLLTSLSATPKAYYTHPEKKAETTLSKSTVASTISPSSTRTTLPIYSRHKSRKELNMQRLELELQRLAHPGR